MINTFIRKQSSIFHSYLVPVSQFHDILQQKVARKRWIKALVLRSGTTSCSMPMNSEKAQLSWFSRELMKRDEKATSLDSTSASTRCSTNEGQGSTGAEIGE
jgi:hypothetical protein